MTRNDVDIDVVLAEDYKVKDNTEFNGRFNKTSRFVLPMLGLVLTSKIVSKYLKNAFIDDKSIEHDFKKAVFLLFKVKNQKEKEWQDLLRLFATGQLYKDAYIMDYYVGQEDGCTLIMYVFDLPSEWEQDYTYFKAGRYSKMSDAYKAKFPRTVYAYNGDPKESREWGILNKSDIIKDEVLKKFVNPATTRPDEVIALRKDMDSWDEVWDAPHPAEEIYHYAEDSTTDSTSVRADN